MKTAVKVGGAILAVAAVSVGGWFGKKHFDSKKSKKTEVVETESK